MQFNCHRSFARKLVSLGHKQQADETGKIHRVTNLQLIYNIYRHRLAKDELPTGWPSMLSNILHRNNRTRQSSRNLGQSFKQAEI